jgi:hypothetical protein
MQENPISSNPLKSMCLLPSHTTTPQSSIVRWERKCKEEIKKRKENVSTPEQREINNLVLQFCAERIG